MMNDSPTNKKIYQYKAIGFCLMLLSFVACKEIIDKPKNLIPKQEMAEIIVDFALNDQSPITNHSGNLEAGTRYILQQKKVKGQDFIDSYQYYIIQKEIDGIYDDAQQIILNKNPESEKFILEQIKKNKNSSTATEKLQQ
jgi:hypothetical protein